MVDDKILIARELRAQKIKELSQKSDTVTVKSNVPGWEKNIDSAHILSAYFIKRCAELGVYDIERLDGADGLTYFGKTADGKALKEKAVNLEQTHPIGRFIDIDITLKGEEKSLSRKDMRKCYLCDRPAFICGREKTHTTSQLLSFFNDKTQSYFENLIENIIKYSMLEELNLDDKFGLVTPTSNGSHTDLNYSVMVSAINAVNARLKDAFFIGFKAEKTDNLLDKLRPIGIECEDKMLSATDGANAYKGFIFVGGALLAAAGFCLKKGKPFSEIYNVCANICADLSTPLSTFGFSAYKNGFGGIRKQAKMGFPAVKKAKQLLENNSLITVLKNIVKSIDDSVLLKRAKSVERYEYFKNLISNCADGREKQVTKECIENNISIGGAADILIAALMLKKIEKTFYFEG